MCDIRAVISDVFHGSDPKTGEDLQILAIGSLLMVLLQKREGAGRGSHGIIPSTRNLSAENNFSIIHSSPRFNQLVISGENSLQVLSWMGKSIGRASYNSIWKSSRRVLESPEEEPLVLKDELPPR